MIIDWIMQILLTIVGGLIGLFPAYSLPGSMTGFGSTLGSTFATLNGVFPVQTLGVCLAAVMGLWLFLTAWDAIIFVYRLIPGKFT